MQLTLAKLEKKAKDNGLTVKIKGKKPAKSDYVDALRAHFLPAGGLPYEEVEPMLCFAEWNLKEDELKNVWESPNWMAQTKFNGCRLMMHFVKDVGVFAHSRTVSVKTFRFEELTEHLLFADVKPNFSATIDAEVMIEKPVDTTGYTVGGDGAMTKSSLHSVSAVMKLKPAMSKKLQKEQDAPLIVKVFDIIRWNGEDLRPMMLKSRLARLERDFIPAIQAEPQYAPYFDFPGWTIENKKAYKDQIIAAGGEGVILKNLQSKYEDSSSRLRNAWVKCKKRVEYDAYVSGFIRGTEDTGWKNMVGALTFSVMTEDGEHEIANVSNVSMETRAKITVYDPATDTVSLHPSVYGRVAEVSGQDISARSMRLSHATLDRWRPKQGPDAKTKDQCIVSMADLRAASEWVG